MNRLSIIAIGPIIRAMLRNKYNALLVVLQIAVTMAIICNGMFIALERAKLLERHSGLDEVNTFYLTSSGFTETFNPRVNIEQDLHLLRNTEGIINAVQSNSFPLSDGGTYFKILLNQDPSAQGSQAAEYKLDLHGLQSFDLSIVAGQNFSATDVVWQTPSDNSWPGVVLLTKAMAQDLFGNDDWQQAVGKTVYIEGVSPVIIKGIVDQLQAPWTEWPNVENVVIAPVIVSHNSARYVIRTEPGRRDELMARVEKLLASSNNQRMIRKLNSIEYAKAQIYAADIATVNILLVVVIVISIVTAMGIAGISSFNITRRRKQIGTRRALGASQGDILLHFMAESFILTILGSVLGVAFALLINLLLVNEYALTPLKFYFLPLSLLAVVIIGQLAVLWPAIKASKVSPALATRTI
jgi:putative ABC transport system permease protein